MRRSICFRLTDRDRLRNVKLPQGKKLSPTDTDIIRMDHLDTVMVGLSNFAVERTNDVLSSTSTEVRIYLVDGSIH